MTRHWSHDPAAYRRDVLRAVIVWRSLLCGSGIAMAAVALLFWAGAMP